MDPRRILIAIFAILGVVASAGVSAQNPQQPFRGSVTLINVDVYPRRDGRVIEGLTTEDFQIFEDGVPQKVDAFEFIRTEPNTPDVERRDPSTQREGDELAADPHNRLFVVYLDIYHTALEGANTARLPLLDFLNRTIGANDLFGVLTPEIPPDQLVFGRRTDTLEGELTRNFDWALRGLPITPVGRPAMEAQLQTCATGTAPLLGDALTVLFRENTMMTNLEALLVRLSVLRDERKNILFVSEGWTPRPAATEILNLASRTLPGFGQGPGGVLTMDPERGMGRSQSWCNQQIAQLGNIDFEQRFRDLLTHANRANVSFYPVDVGGLRSGVSSLRSNRSIAFTPADAAIEPIIASHQRPDVTTLRVLAENTDGMAIFNSNDIRAGFRRIADDLSAYYLLGYSSTNTKVDGKFRRIEVKVKQPDVKVTARRGYVGPSMESRAASAAAAAAVAVPPAAAAELGRLSRVRADAELFSYGVARDGRLHVAVEISGPEMARGRWSGGADVQATATGTSGGELTGTARIDAGARGAIVEIALPPGAAGPWRTKLRASQADAELSDQLEIADQPRDSAPLLGVPLLFRGTASSRIPLRPVADFQFRRNERVRVEWPVTAPLDERIARVLDRRGAALPLPATATETDGPAGRVVHVDLNLAPLAAGDYLIELTAGKAGQTERGLMAFRVVR